MHRLIFVLTWVLLTFQSVGYAYDGRFTLAAERAALTRAGYVEEVEGLKDLANSARAAGQDGEATALMVSAERRYELG
jgi:hypothetical protein